jgi:hypothetical protein
MITTLVDHCCLTYHCDPIRDFVQHLFTSMYCQECGTKFDYLGVSKFEQTRIYEFLHDALSKSDVLPGLLMYKCSSISQDD